MSEETQRIQEKSCSDLFDNLIWHMVALTNIVAENIMMTHKYKTHDETGLPLEEWADREKKARSLVTDYKDTFFSKCLIEK